MTSQCPKSHQICECAWPGIGQTWNAHQINTSRAQERTHSSDVAVTWWCYVESLYTPKNSIFWEYLFYPGGGQGISRGENLPQWVVVWDLIFIGGGKIEGDCTVLQQRSGFSWVFWKTNMSLILGIVVEVKTGIYLSACATALCFWASNNQQNSIWLPQNPKASVFKLWGLITFILRTSKAGSLLPPATPCWVYLKPGEIEWKMIWNCAGLGFQVSQLWQ